MISTNMAALLRIASRPKGYAANQFVTTWNLTTDTEAGKTITLPLRSGFTYAASVNWGDGTTTEIAAHDSAGRIHEYAAIGIKTVIITGTVQAWYFNNGGDRLKFRTVEHWGASVGFVALSGAFYGCGNAISFGDAMPAYGGVGTLALAWYNCSSASNFPDVSALTAVTSLQDAWRGCTGALSFPSVSDLLQVNTLLRAWYGTSSEGYPDISSMAGVANIAAAWQFCNSMKIVPSLPTASTNLTNANSAFRDIGSGMGGTVVPLWNTTNFPNITGFDNTFTGATGLANYADIPDAWKGL